MNEEQISSIAPNPFEIYITTAVQYDKEGKYTLAIIFIDRAIKCDVNDVSTRWWYYFYKAKWLWQVKKIDEAFKIVDEGIQTIEYSPILLYLKADMLVKRHEVDTALQLIEDAESIFNLNIPEFKAREEDLPSQFKELETKIKTEAEFRNTLTLLRIEAAKVKAEIDIEAKFSQMEQKLEKERNNIIELLGIFTAVMSLILIGGTLTVNMPIKDALVLISGLAVVLISFMSFLSYSFDSSIKHKKLLHRIIDYRLFIFVLSGLFIYFLVKSYDVQLVKVNTKKPTSQGKLTQSAPIKKAAQK